MRRLLIPLLLFGFGLSAVHAQVLPVRNYGTREGLNAASISAVLRDSRGMLWVGTYNGVNWYDGSRFQQPAMSTRSGQIFVNQFCEDRRRQVWIGSWYSGLYRYADGVFSNWLPDTVNIGSQSNSILHLTELPDGRMFCGTDHNAYVFDGTRFAVFDSANKDLDRQITATACCSKGDIFIGLSNGLELYRREKDGWRFATRVLKGIEVTKLVVSRDTVWIATSKGLYYQTGIGQAPVAVVAGPVGNIFFDRNHTRWYTGAGSGIWRQQPGRVPEHFTRDNGLPSNEVHCGCSDLEGIVWLGTENGLAKLTPAGYRFFPVREGDEGATITALAKDENQRLWAGSYENVFRFDGGDAHEEHTSGGRRYGFVYAMRKDRRRRIWLCTSSGLYCVDKGVARLRSASVISSIYEDHSGILWLGGTDGRVHYVENDQLHSPVFDHLVDQRITGIGRDEDGSLWVGYALAGLRKLKWMDDSLRTIRSWSAENGSPRLLVRSLLDDGTGHLLVGTRTGGLFIISRTGDSVINITRDQGLSGNWIKDVIIDGRQVFLATNNGLDELEAGAYHTPPRHITFNDDRVPVEFNTALLQSDTLWLGTSRGVLEYSLHGQQPDSLAPPVRLLKLAVNGQADSNFRLFTGGTRLRRLAYNQNNVSVDFAALSFRDEDRVRYRYRLEGLDTGWNAFTDRRYVNYMNLAPGDYRFLVQARNADGLLSREPAVIAFSIAAPFWRTPWFLTLTTLAVLSLVYGLYRYRLHQALAIERLRARISTDLHDDTGSTLSSISILSDMALQEEEAKGGGGNGTLLTPMLKEIRDNSLSLLEKMDDIVWSINPRNDTLESLMLRVKRFAAQLFEARGIEYEIDIEPEIRRLRLLMDHRQNLYLIMKEAINNLVKYSDAARAHIRARYQRHHLVVEISDDGRGFPAEAMATGNGIINMQNRAGAMKADLAIRTAPGEGTTVTLSLKITRP
ncbi:MAG TPA: two-component regulator propeller domain-containing protein [Puia sp.]|uniref:sensor histidine kinase n=1 Tax=Puia sp. TaxID=2045100 RepID=UPI002B832973|nr:two-component regulator propeller domain-containing protein [Puia sp.]HVU97632.1 two-component regulator propeller domain-containing protein [Puia sp.]